MTVIYLKSAFDAVPNAVQHAADQGVVTIVEQTELTPEQLLFSRGLITGNQLDQNGMIEMRATLAAFLDAGGRWFLNGHLLRPLLDGMAQYRPIQAPKRVDLSLQPINAHPIFAGIALDQIDTSHGVAGFYGRGCNPMPLGAVAINGLGPGQVPVDWVWARPGGGRVFSHAGSELSSMGTDWNLSDELTRRVIDWVGGGTCLDPWPADPARPVGARALEEAEVFAGVQGRANGARRIVLPSTGAYHIIRSLEGPRYASSFDISVPPEELSDVLRPADVLWVPCRTPAQRMMPQRDVIARHLDAGGTVVALGESRSDLWLPAVDFTATPTNWWWWMDPEVDLGVTITAPDHPLMRGMSKADVTWHLHGWFTPPNGAEVLLADGEGRAILYVDEVSSKGCMILSSLDPMFHHGAHFMPATTRFLDRFVPNLKAYCHE